MRLAALVELSLNSMSGKLKLFLVLLAGVSIGLSACNDISVQQTSPPNEAGQSPGNRPEATPTTTTRLFKETKSSASHSPASQPSQTSSPNNSDVKTTTASAKAHRENYKPISLTKIADAKALASNDPKALALSAFGNIESEGGSRDVTVDYPQPNQAIVTITQTGVADDSVGAIRYRVELQPEKSAQTGKQWEIVWAGSQVKCHPGRGHQDWSTELCL
jgi:cytoskeletal protein RodZ